MQPLSLAFIPLALAASMSVPRNAEADGGQNALRFFEGSTESLSTVKVLMKKPYRSRAIGVGKIRTDGSLELVQQVTDDGRPAKMRRWLVHQVAPGRYSGTMTEALGPVDVQEVDGRYRFRFKMKGHLAVEQWLTPQPGGRAASNKATIRKFGMKVASAEGVIRKI